MNKDQSIVSIVNYFQTKYGTTNVLINDHWEADLCAIGLTDESSQFVAYISTYSNNENEYYLALENPPTDDTMPYSPAGTFVAIGLAELEQLVTKHLRLIH